MRSAAMDTLQVRSIQAIRRQPFRPASTGTLFSVRRSRYGARRFAALFANGSGRSQSRFESRAHHIVSRFLTAICCGDPSIDTRSLMATHPTPAGISRAPPLPCTATRSDARYPPAAPRIRRLAITSSPDPAKLSTSRTRGRDRVRRPRRAASNLTVHRPRAPSGSSSRGHFSTNEPGSIPFTEYRSGWRADARLSFWPAGFTARTPRRRSSATLAGLAPGSTPQARSTVRNASDRTLTSPTRAEQPACRATSGSRRARADQGSSWVRTPAPRL